MSVRASHSSVLTTARCVPPDSETRAKSSSPVWHRSYHLLSFSIHQPNTTNPPEPSQPTDGMVSWTTNPPRRTISIHRRHRLDPPAQQSQSASRPALNPPALQSTHRKSTHRTLLAQSTTGRTNPLDEQISIHPGDIASIHPADLGAARARSSGVISLDTPHASALPQARQP